jgi:hypothetical protein
LQEKPAFSASMHLAVDLLVAKIPPDHPCQWQAGGAGALKARH